MSLYRCLLLLLVFSSCGGGSRSNVRIALPLPPKLDLSTCEHVYFAGFISENPNEFFKPDTEAVNYFVREFTRQNILSITAAKPLDFTGKDARTLFEKEQPFFKGLPIPESDTTLTVTGSLNFEVLDRSGFRQVEVTDLTGRSYYKNQYVEITGFDLTMKVFVYDLSGKLLYTEALKDTLDVEGTNADQRLVFYDLLQRMSTRVLGLFTNTVVKADRSLL